MLVLTSQLFTASACVETAPPQLCNSVEWECQGGECVYITQKCNGHNDCPDGSDEWNCPGVLVVHLSYQEKNNRVYIYIYIYICIFINI